MNDLKLDDGSIWTDCPQCNKRRKLAPGTKYSTCPTCHKSVWVEGASVADLAPVTKPTNPKDAIGSTKLGLGIVPGTGSYYAAEAFLEGALKYGRFNWRVAGVRASIYYDALRSHGEKWWNGQDRDPLTRVRELGSMRACLDILIDAIECEMLTDDRPPAMPEGALEKLRNSPTVTHLLLMYPTDREGAPHQYTIKDTVTKAPAK